MWQMLLMPGAIEGQDNSALGKYVICGGALPNLHVSPTLSPEDSALIVDVFNKEYRLKYQAECVRCRAELPEYVKAKGKLKAFYLKQKEYTENQADSLVNAYYQAVWQKECNAFKVTGPRLIFWLGWRDINHLESIIDPSARSLATLDQFVWEAYAARFSGSDQSLEHLLEHINDYLIRSSGGVKQLPYKTVEDVFQLAVYVNKPVFWRAVLDLLDEDFVVQVESHSPGASIVEVLADKLIPRLYPSFFAQHSRFIGMSSLDKYLFRLDNPAEAMAADQHLLKTFTRIYTNPPNNQQHLRGKIDEMSFFPISLLKN